MVKGSLKVLENIGYKLVYERRAIDAFDWCVESLKDLTDGIRLARMAEILSGDMSHKISESLNIEPQGNQQKILNTTKAVSAFKDIGLECPCDPKLIAKGDTRTILDFLWNILMCSEFPLLVDLSALQREIQSFSATSITEKDLMSLLLLWCQSLCAQHNVEVRDWDTSFSDGKVFCIILHHYHPEIVSLKDIHTTTTDSFPHQKKVFLLYSFSPQSPYHHTGCHEIN